MSGAVAAGAGRAAAWLALWLAIAPGVGCDRRPPPEADGLPTGRVTIGGDVVEVEVARTDKARARGLSGRDTLAPDRGMLFLHPEPRRHGYWMKDMRFDIDILWLRDGRIVDVTHRARHPARYATLSEIPSYAPREPVDAVLEVPAGTARARGWERGQGVILKIPEAD